MKYVRTPLLEIAYEEAGELNETAVILLHGFPYDIHVFEVASTRLAKGGLHVYAPFLRGFGNTRFLSEGAARSGEQAAIATDLLAFMDALKIERAILAGFDWGGRAACIVSALWPERVRGLVTCGTAYNIQTGSIRPPMAQAARYWYVWFMHSAQGERRLRDREERKMFVRYLWETWSPAWHFEESLFETVLISFENPDFCDVVLHSYRHRTGEVDGDSRYRKVRDALKNAPRITVPTIALYGENDGVTSRCAEAPDVGKRFIHRFEEHVIKDAGHAIPAERPEAFTDAVFDLLR